MFRIIKIGYYGFTLLCFVLSVIFFILGVLKTSGVFYSDVSFGILSFGFAALYCVLAILTYA